MPTSMNTKTATIRFGAIAVSATGECLEYLLVCIICRSSEFQNFSVTESYLYRV